RYMRSQERASHQTELHHNAYRRSQQGQVAYPRLQGGELRAKELCSNRYCHDDDCSGDQQYQQRYGIYWKFISNGTVIEEKLPRAKVSNSDTVQPGYGQYENDNLHNMIEYHSKGVTDDSTYRYATDGGWFTYTMAVDETAPMTVLNVKLRKADNGKSLKVRVGDAVLLAETLAYDGKEEVYDRKIQIPSDVLKRCVYDKNADGTDYRVLDVTFSSNDGDKDSAKVCDFLYMTAVKPAYDFDSSIAYFIDCGDQNTSTLTGKDKLGLYNCVTEQLCGADEVTGNVWGLIDDPTDRYNGSGKGGGIYTANTWCDESHGADGAAKNNSFRYTKNQFENNIARHLDYSFTLPNGTYSIEASFADPWGCSKNPTLYANLGKADESVIAKNCAISTTVKGTAKVTDGTLTINARSEDKAINLCYLVIRPEETEPASVIGQKGDVNLDGTVDVTDVVTFRKHLMGLKDFNGEQAYAADVAADAQTDVFDLAMLKYRLLHK
ncbi:MAG: dockerin type I repeat-containing protein, partial [Oscillospiraceae bacterium]|nr:dockerin type I repeat-containing protein [Oscillospiraceae bacterium]